MGRTGRVWRLVDVLAVNVYGVRDEGGAAISAASVPLFESEQLNLGLDAFDDAWSHCDRGLYSTAG